MKLTARILVKLSFGCFVLALLSVTAAAQIPRPGYTFVEVKDERNKPVQNAVGVVYDAKGVEIGSGVTNQEGKAGLVQNGYHQSELIIRVVKSGYVTFEGRATAGARYVNQTIKVTLKERPGESGRAVYLPKRSKPYRRALSPPRRIPENST